MSPPGSPLEKYAAGVRADRQPHRRAAHEPDGPGRASSSSTTWPTRTASSAPCTSPATWRTSARAPRRTSATSSPWPTSGRSCTSARPTAATRCSARSRTACARPPTTAGPRSKFLAEQFMLLGITDKVTGKKWHIAGGFPSASGKTNLAMTLAPDALGDRYYVEFYGDDIAWMWVGEDGRLYGMNPEFGVFGVAKDTNEKTNPTALDAIAPGTRSIFTNIAYNEKTQEVWFEGRTAEPAGRPRRLAGLEGRPDRGPLRGGQERPLGPPEQPVHHHAGQRAQRRGRLREPGRRADRRHHLRRPHQRPRAADPGDQRRRRGRLRRAHAGRRGDVRRRRPGRAAPLRPDVDAPVHVLPGGPVRRALAEHRRRGHRQADLRPRQLVPAGRRRRPLPLARLPGQPARAAVADAAARRRGDRRRSPRSASCRPRTSSTPTASRSTRPTSTRCSPSTPTGGSRRSASARRTWSSSPTSRRRSGRPTAASPRPSTRSATNQPGQHA